MKFRMVDRILDWQGRRQISGIKTVSFEEYDLKSAFGGQAYLPESLLLEGLFQLGNWLIILSSDFTRMGLVVRVGQVRFDGFLEPGQSVRMTANVVSYREDGIVFDGEARVGGRRIALGKGCLAAPTDLAEFCDPEALRTLFSEIYRPPEKGPAQVAQCPV